MLASQSLDALVRDALMSSRDIPMMGVSLAVLAVITLGVTLLASRRIRPGVGVVSTILSVFSLAAGDMYWGHRAAAISDARTLSGIIAVGHVEIRTSTDLCPVLGAADSLFGRRVDVKPCAIYGDGDYLDISSGVSGSLTPAPPLLGHSLVYATRPPSVWLRVRDVMAVDRALAANGRSGGLLSAVALVGK
jgi:hypothetical protein